MLCACSGEQFKFEEPTPQSPESLATRDFSASGLSSSRTGTGEWDSKFEDAQVDEAETTLKEALSLNYEEARALLGRLEYQKGNYDAALSVFHGIDIKALSQKMSESITERTRQRKSRSKYENAAAASVMSLHSVSLILEAILLKAKSLQQLCRIQDAARECKAILDIVESALPNGMPEGINDDSKLQEMFHKALELLPKLWIQATYIDEAIIAYRRALIKPWNLEPQRLATIQKQLAVILLYAGVDSTDSPHLKMEEAILLLFTLMQKVLYGEIAWDQEVIDHLTFALSICGGLESLADHYEQALPGIYIRVDRWFFLALCYSAAGQNDTALNLLKKIPELNLKSFLLGAKLCSQDPKHAHKGINYASRVIELKGHQNEHFKGLAYRFLGVCYGNAARISVSDTERAFLHREALLSLNRAAQIDGSDCEVIFYLGLENGMQRNIGTAFRNAMLYSDLVCGNSGKGWKLLALIASADQRFEEAEDIVDLALDETSRVDQLDLLRLKALLQISQERPKQAIETYRVLLSLIQGTGGVERKLEMEAWLDLAKIYLDLESWIDAEICIKKSNSIESYFPRGWHTTGLLLEAQLMHKEALIAYMISLSSDPDYVASIVSTAKVLMKMGCQMLPIARSFLMNALRLEPTNHDAWFNLGLICKMEGLMKQAAEFFQAAHDLKLSAPVQSFLSLCKKD